MATADLRVLESRRRPRWARSREQSRRRVERCWCAKILFTRKSNRVRIIPHIFDVKIIFNEDNEDIINGIQMNLIESHRISLDFQRRSHLEGQSKNVLSTSARGSLRCWSRMTLKRPWPSDTKPASEVCFPVQTTRPKELTTSTKLKCYSWHVIAP